MAHSGVDERGSTVPALGWEARVPHIAPTMPATSSTIGRTNSERLGAWNDFMSLEETKYWCGVWWFMIILCQPKNDRVSLLTNIPINVQHLEALQR